MSDRYIAFTVILKNDMKDEDSKQISDAISMVKGVSKIIPIVRDGSYTIAIEKAKLDLISRLQEVLT